MLVCVPMCYHDLLYKPRVGGVVRAIFPHDPHYYGETYLQGLRSALQNEDLEKTVSSSFQMRSLPKDVLDHIPSKALHLDVDDEFHVIGLRFCSAWFHMEWVRKRGLAATLALAFGAWRSGTAFEQAVLSTLPFVGTALFRQLNRSDATFDRFEIHELEVHEKMGSADISAVCKGWGVGGCAASLISVISRS